MKKLFQISLIMILLSGLFQIRIFADQTYININANEITKVVDSTKSNLERVFIQANKNVRYTGIRSKTNEYYAIGVVSTEPFQIRNGYSTSNLESNSYSNATKYTLNGTNYYYWYIQGGNYNWYQLSSEVMIQLSDFSTDSSYIRNKLIYYTYGDGAVAPEPVINYGLLDMHYSANINPGLIESSVDHIVSNGYDVNGNDLSGNILQIRAIPGYYTDESRELINQLNVTDFVRQDDALYVVYSDVITHENKIDLEWSQVVQHFPPGIRWFGFVPYLDPVEQVYYARGWIYEYCVTNLDGDTLIDWTRIYNTTGMPPAVTTPIVSSDNLNPDLVNAIEVINNINNNTENWYLQNIEINMTNSEGTESTQKPWWAYLLEAILGFLNNILDTILKLFQFDSFELPNFESEHQNLINNTGMFGETIQFESQIQDLISSATYTDPVLYYPGLQLEGVNLIPEVNINLNDYVNQLGLTDLQQIAYIVTDGSIYLSLFLLIKNKLMEILKK